MNRPNIYIVGDDHDAVQQLKASVAGKGFPVLGSGISSHDLVPFDQLPDDRIGLVMITSASRESLDLVGHIREKDRNLPVIIAPAKSSEAQAIAAFRAGASDYLQPPTTIPEVMSCLRRWLSDDVTKGSRSEIVGDGQLIARSTAMQEIKASIKKLALTDSSVLITGETGTGKDLVAELIYRNSTRNQKPFVCLNCAAIPEALLESELFGHERGAFTGAVCAQKGKFEQAQGGTLFLDEIGEMGLAAQAKILRAIDTKQIYRLGGQGGRRYDVRLIAATNQPLKQLVQEGKFRKDLFFRLKVATIDVPPLRNRQEEIPTLLNYFIHKLNLRRERVVHGVSPQAMEAFVRYSWPGNVRELKNVLESLFADPSIQEITWEHLPEDIRTTPLGPEFSNAERKRILAVLNLTKWNKTWAARQLHWSRMTLYRKLAKYHIQDAWHSTPHTHDPTDVAR